MCLFKNTFNNDIKRVSVKQWYLKKFKIKIESHKELNVMYLIFINFCLNNLYQGVVFVPKIILPLVSDCVISISQKLPYAFDSLKLLKLDMHERNECIANVGNDMIIFTFPFIKAIKVLVFILINLLDRFGSQRWCSIRKLCIHWAYRW